MSIEFSLTNYTILGIYLVAMVYIGYRFAGRQHTADDYFLAGRAMPWLPVAMSMYASVTSAVTFMGLPGMAYADNVSLIVVSVVSPVVAPFLIFLFYPFYRRMRVTTSYEYILLRFGPRARWAVSSLFLLARLGWMGTVIYAPSLALSAVTGIPLALSIVLMGALATAYTVLGGLAAVLWTDMAQFIILVIGAVWIAVTLTAASPDGVAGIMAIAHDSGKLDIFEWSMDWSKMSIYIVSFSFFLKMMQEYGTDQVTVQRLMAVRTDRGVVKAIVFNAVTDFLLVALLLFIGLGLFAFYAARPEIAPDALSSDQMLPFFIMRQMPDGVSGLLIAAIFAAAMSSMDSGINSITTVVMHDFVEPLRKNRVTPRNDVRDARWLTLGLGTLATVMAFYASTLDHIVKAFATFMSLFSAPVLAIFLLGMLSRRASFSGWLVGVVVAVPVTWLAQQSDTLHWVYYFPVCFLITLTLGWLASFGFRNVAPVDPRATLYGRSALESQPH